MESFKNYLTQSLNEGIFTDQKLRIKELEDNIFISKKELVRLFLAIAKGEIKPSQINLDEIQEKEQEELRKLRDAKNSRSKKGTDPFSDYEPGRSREPTSGWN
jgi:hypothetical protein